MSTEAASAPVQSNPGFRSLYKYATALDYLLIGCALVGAIGMGVIQPLLFFFMGRIYSDLDVNDLEEGFYDNTVFIVYLLLGLGALYMVCSYIAVILFAIVGSRQASHFRREYMKAILRQDPEWFDQQAVAELPNAIISDTVKIERATGDKLAVLVFTSAMVLSAFGLAIYEALQLTLVAFLFGPAVIWGLYIANKTFEQAMQYDNRAYKKAGGIVEEALMEIKTVAAHNAQTAERDKYDSALRASYMTKLTNGLKIGGGTGLAMASYIGMLGAIVVTAATLIRDEKENWVDGNTIDVGSAIVIITVCVMAFNNVGVLVPCIKLVVEGVAACREMMVILKNSNKIVNGTHAGKLRGEIEFKHVEFAYASALNKPVLRDFTTSVQPGDTLAILGETGSGKSTVISLLMRFYDPLSGEILVDGVNVKDWDLTNLRSQIGLVSQEPILFNTTIKENIRFGLPSATDEQIEEAARHAEVLDSVKELPQQFDTQVGSKGSQLAGGEKQRIAIARAIVRKPVLLLLDESTSALDKNTEAAVQQTLNQLMSFCTTIMIAHRISTIRKATKVIVMREGQIIESGTQEELTAKQGQFYHIGLMQNMRIDDDQAEPNTTQSSHSLRKRESKIELIQTQPQEQAEKGNYAGRISRMAKGSCGWILLGCAGAVVSGFAMPCEGMIIGLELNTLAKTTGRELEEDSRFYGGMLGCCAVGLLLGMILESISFPRVSAQVTRTMRQESFKALLSYDLGFFDKNSPTVMATRLSNDCEKVNGIGGNILGLFTGIFCAIGAGIAISGAYCWPIMLVFLALLPLFLGSLTASFILQAQGLMSYNYEEATVYASDCIINYKTVKAFCMEDYLLTRYLEVITRVSQKMRSKAHFTAMIFAIGFGLLFYLYALMFWFSAKLFLDGFVGFESMNVALYAATESTMGIFITVLFAPDVKQGQIAAKNLCKVLDYEPVIDPNSEEGCKEPVSGTIRFDRVCFKYPTRELLSLSEVSFTVPAGSTFAIVGTTGSGKSTIIQLLLRFYDTTEGCVYIDNRDIRDYNVRHLRNQIAIVGQEPVLFSGSIASNIAYGIEASEEDIQRAAEQAQVMNFIRPQDGFSREVGLRGSHLSGGEKQRVAIARAIIRKPKILILDEATSALDSDTEARLVDILRGVMAGRTCVVVAHRIKTISALDQIAVLSNGDLLELGGFNELMEKKGFLYSLAKQR